MAINRRQLLEAMMDYDSEVQYFVNTLNGEVFRVTLREPQTVEQIKRAFANTPTGIVKLPKLTSQEKYNELQTFINSIDDAALRSKLLDHVLPSPNPHRELHLALERRFKETRQYESYKLQCAERHLDRFLKDVNIK